MFWEFAEWPGKIMANSPTKPIIINIKISGMKDLL
jgi:hypothetical protein